MFLADDEKWSPVVPADLHRTHAPDVAADGTIECGFCKARVALAKTEVIMNAYACASCLAQVQRSALQQQYVDVDSENAKLGRGRWWVTPAFILGAIALVAAFMLAT
jgi:hypothetical protein